MRLRFPSELAGSFLSAIQIAAVRDRNFLQPLSYGLIDGAVWGRCENISILEHSFSAVWAADDQTTSLEKTMSPDNCERIAVKKEDKQRCQKLNEYKPGLPSWSGMATFRSPCRWHWARGGRTTNTRRIDVECRQVKKEMVRLSSPPDTCLLSNDRYSVFLTAAGSGYSAVDGMDVTRWREDATCDCWGQYCYIRDLHDGRFWSAGRQPTGRVADEYQAELRPDRVAIRRRDGELETCYEVAIVPDAKAEVRRVKLTNHGNRARILEITSYLEVALNPRGADQAHPAFAKLFLETEYLHESGALLCRRRPQAQDQQPLWAMHVLAGAKDLATARGGIQFETDRSRFLGRGRTTANPAALENRAPLSRTVGPVLDPVFSLRSIVQLAPGASTVLAFTTAAPRDRDEALALAGRFSDLREVDRAFDEAIPAGQALLAEMDLSLQDAHVFQRLAAHVLFTSPFLRSHESVIANKLGQADLWPHAVSGDLPIVLLRIGEDITLAREILKAHRYWRRIGLVTDLVLLNDGSAGLRQSLEALVQSSPSAELAGKPGGIYLLDAAALSLEEKTLFEAAARVILRDCDGSLSEQLFRGVAAPVVHEGIGGKTDRDDGGSNALRAHRNSSVGDLPAGASEPLLFDNGLGGFTPDGREYVISLHGGERPPAPWVNVLANPDFGCVVTEAGGGYTWAGNSQMNRLTPWSNDPVSDPPGEAVYLRDEETGEFWSPTPAPCGSQGTTVVRHGQGYSRFTCTSFGLEQDLIVLVSPEAPVKLFHLRITNPGNRPRRLSAAFYAEWVVGIQRDRAPLQVVCAADSESGALFATNAWAGEFAGRVAFADVSRRPRSFTCDRAEFIGRERTTANPAAMTQKRLSGRSGELGDPCAAIMINLELPPGGNDDIVFLLGQAASPEDARTAHRRVSRPGTCQGGAGRCASALEWRPGGSPGPYA